MLLAVCHSDEAGWEEVDDLDRLSDLRSTGGNLLWAEADVADLGKDDVDVISEEFGLHDLAVEDAVHTRQRPKVEDYDDHLFVVIHQLDEVDGQLEARQIACFVGDRYLLTVHDGADRIVTEAKRRWETDPLPRNAPSDLLHILLDVAVDDYQDITDRLENELEDLEEIALETPNADIQRQLYSVKQRIARLRRYVLPAVRVLDWVVGPEGEKPFSRQTATLFRDVHDHVVRISEQVKNIDEIVGAVLDLTRGAQAQNLNEVSRKLTAWAAIFAANTVIAGIYGMNFQLIPNENTIGGFTIALAMMLVTSVALFFYFRRKRWL